MGRVIEVQRRRGLRKLTEEELADVMEALKRGDLVVYPTDTLYGLGVDPYDEEAVRRLFAVKRRPMDEPISVMVADLKAAKDIAHLGDRDLKLWKKFIPGPLTLLVRAKPSAPGPPISSKGVLGLRMPDHPVALQIAREFGPVTSTSANLHGETPPREVKTAIDQLGNEVSIYLDCGPCRYGIESTVIDVTGHEAIVKREGVLSIEELRSHEW